MPRPYAYARLNSNITEGSEQDVPFRTLVAVIGYAGAAWGLYKATAWWRPLTIAGSIVGSVVLLLWSTAVRSLSGVTNMAANLALHDIGIAVLLLALLVPSLRRDLERRLAGHRGAMR